MENLSDSAWMKKKVVVGQTGNAFPKILPEGKQQDSDKSTAFLCADDTKKRRTAFGILNT